MSDPSQSGANRVGKLFGAMLMAAGGLIAALSGLCSLAVLVTAVSNAVQQPRLNAQGAAMALPLVLIVGGIPFGIGVGLFILGRKLYRGR